MIIVGDRKVIAVKKKEGGVKERKRKTQREREKKE